MFLSRLSMITLVDSRYESPLHLFNSSLRSYSSSSTHSFLGSSSELIKLNNFSTSASSSLLEGEFSRIGLPKTWSLWNADLSGTSFLTYWLQWASTALSNNRSLGSSNSPIESASGRRKSGCWSRLQSSIMIIKSLHATSLPILANARIVSRGFPTISSFRRSS